jgi:chromosome segregation ATPase
MQQQLSELRATLAQIHTQLIEAEADLADQLAEINAFEFEFEARVGHLMDTLETLEAEIQKYNEYIQIARNRQIFGTAHVPVENQYRRAWQAPPDWAPTPPPQPVDPVSEAEIKKLYRQLARRFHPDLAVDEADRALRTEKMTAVNNAYAARSLAELVTLDQEPDIVNVQRIRPGQTEAQLVQALQAELTRCQRRLREIEKELRGLRFRPSVELSLEVKAAKKQGRDLLAEMVTELEHKIARKTVERDMLKAQFDQLGPDHGFIIIDREKR